MKCGCKRRARAPRSRRQSQIMESIISNVDPKRLHLFIVPPGVQPATRCPLEPKITHDPGQESALCRRLDEPFGPKPVLDARHALVNRNEGLVAEHFLGLFDRVGAGAVEQPHGSGR